MRTTLVIEDRLLGAAKREAAKRGLTLSALVSAALRDALREPQADDAERFELLTFGGAREPAVQHEPSDFSAALAAEDRERLGR